MVLHKVCLEKSCALSIEVISLVFQLSKLTGEIE